MPFLLLPLFPRAFDSLTPHPVCQSSRLLSTYCVLGVAFNTRSGPKKGSAVIVPFFRGRSWVLRIAVTCPRPPANEWQDQDSSPATLLTSQPLPGPQQPLGTRPHAHMACHPLHGPQKQLGTTCPQETLDSIWGHVGLSHLGGPYWPRVGWGPRTLLNFNSTELSGPKCQ